MKESISSRVGRLISGSVNAVIDAVENAAPEVVMEQALREIDGATDEVRAELGRVIANKHLANKRLLEESARHDALAEQIELAVQQEREDLAEAAISRQMDIEAQMPVLESGISDATARQKELESYIAALAARRREMENELQQYRAAQKSAAAAAQSGDSSGHNDAARKVTEAERAFNRVMARSGAPGSIGMNADSAKLAELEDLSRKNRIRERLEQIKAKSGQ